MTQRPLVLLVNKAGVRRYLGGMHVAVDALTVLERHVGDVVLTARELTEESGRRRVDGIAMRRAIRRGRLL